MFCRRSEFLHCDKFCPCVGGLSESLYCKFCQCFCGHSQFLHCDRVLSVRWWAFWEFVLWGMSVSWSVFWLFVLLSFVSVSLGIVSTLTFVGASLGVSFVGALAGVLSASCVSALQGGAFWLIQMIVLSFVYALAGASRWRGLIKLLYYEGTDKTVVGMIITCSSEVGGLLGRGYCRESRNLLLSLWR